MLQTTNKQCELTARPTCIDCSMGDEASPRTVTLPHVRHVIGLRNLTTSTSADVCKSDTQFVDAWLLPSASQASKSRDKLRHSPRVTG